MVEAFNFDKQNREIVLYGAFIPSDISSPEITLFGNVT